jgi:hypothetical protein
MGNVMSLYLLFVIVFYSISVIDIPRLFVLIKDMMLMCMLLLEFLKSELAGLVERGAGTAGLATVPVLSDPTQRQL